MAEPPDLKYEAIRPIEVNGVTAYNIGDLVHVSAVEGDGAWLRDGVDVRPRPGVRLDMPAKNASTQSWADFAVSTGADRDEAEGMSRDALIAAYGPQEA